MPETETITLVPQTFEQAARRISDTLDGLDEPYWTNALRSIAPLSTSAEVREAAAFLLSLPRRTPSVCPTCGDDDTWCPATWC